MALQNVDSAVYVNAAPAAYPNFDQDLTICFWARFANLTDVGCVWSMSDTAGGKHLNIGIRGGNVGAYAWGGGAMVQTPYVANDLYFVTFRFQGTSAKVRLNDNADVSAVYTRPTGAGVQGFQMLGNQFGDNLNGIIRDLRRYSRVLSDNEVQTLYYSEGTDADEEIIRERYIMNEKTSGATLSAFTDFKDYTGRVYTMTGVGTSTNLIYNETMMRGSTRGSNV